MNTASAQKSISEKADKHEFQFIMSDYLRLLVFLKAPPLPMILLRIASVFSVVCGLLNLMVNRVSAFSAITCSHTSK
jgi:hypothetical protein